MLFTRRRESILARALMAAAEEARVALEVIGGYGDRNRPCGCLADPRVFGHICRGEVSGT